MNNLALFIEECQTDQLITDYVTALLESFGFLRTFVPELYREKEYKPHSQKGQDTSFPLSSLLKQHDGRKCFFDLCLFGEINATRCESNVSRHLLVCVIVKTKRS